MRWVALSCFALAGFSAAHGQDSGAGKPVAMQSGLWESTTAFTDMEFTGLTKEQVEAMRRQVVPPLTASQCVTPEQAANPLSNVAQQDRCNYDRHVFSGGTIDIAGTCVQPDQGKVRINLTGTYTADSFNAQFRSESRFAQGGADRPWTVRMSAALHGRRTGRCAGEATIPKPGEGATG